jgi:hypothetical protein
MQWDPVWRLYKPLGSLFPVMAAKGLDIAIDEVSEALSIHVVPPAIQIVLVPIGVIVLLGLRNPPRSCTDTVVCSLLGITIAPCVDSLLCYRIDQAA